MLQHVIWTGLLNILMVPLTEGSRPEQATLVPSGPLSCPAALVASLALVF